MTTLIAASLAALAAWLATPRSQAPHRLATLQTATATATAHAHASASHSSAEGVTASITPTWKGEAVTRRGAAVTGRAGKAAIRGGTAAARGGNAPGRGGKLPVLGGKALGWGGRGALRGGIVAAGVGWVWAQVRRREGAVRWVEAGIELCQSMAAELRAGRTPGDALHAAVEVLPAEVRDGLRGVSAVASAGGDVPAELSAVADSDPDAAGLRQVAAAWRVGAGSGSGLADVLERVAQTLRDDQAHRAQVTAQLAGPRATARLLAALPLLGLGLAAGSGANPLAFLFGSPAGLACLAAGLSLDALGLWWSTQITKAALTPSK